MKRLKDNSDKNKNKLKEKDKATSYSPTKEWVLTAASTKEPEEREFVEDSGASMHLVSMRDQNSAKLETMRTSRSPTTVMTANCEQTREETTVYVRQLDLFVKVLLLEETPAVLSLGILCEDHGFSYHWISGQKPHLIRNGKRIDCNFSNCVPFVVFGVYQRVLPQLHCHLLLHHLLHRTRHLISTNKPKIQYPKEVEVRVKSFDETRCINPQKPKTKIKMGNQKKYKAIYCMNFLIGDRKSRRIWLMKVLQQSLGETQKKEVEDTSKSSHDLPMVPRPKVEPGSGKNSVFTHFPKDPNCDICLKTKNNKELLAEDVLVQSYFVQKILVT